jgi:hypothetical protein
MLKAEIHVLKGAPVKLVGAQVRNDELVNLGVIGFA